MLIKFMRLVVVMSFLLVLVGYNLPEKHLPRGIPIVVSHPLPTIKGDLSIYMQQMALRESNNTLSVINRIGMMGKYQFSPKTLWGLGLDFKVTKEVFLSDEMLQDRAMINYLQRNRMFLDSLIIKYDKTWHNGIFITESGLLAGAHLVGPHGLRAFFDSTYTIIRNARSIRPITKDANGTDVLEYITSFSGYDLKGLEVQ